MIREAAKLIGTEVAAADNTVGQTTLRDHLTWIWHTSSGSAHGFDWQSHRSEEHTSELQSRFDLVCRLLLEKKKAGMLFTILSTPCFNSRDVYVMLQQVGC